MNALFLAGNSPHNKEWVYQLQTVLAPLFQKSLVHEYAHWAAAGPSIDLDHELHSVRQGAHTLGDYIIIAKSAGSLLAMKGISERALQPKKCICMGVPIGMATQHGYQLETWLRALTIPTLFIQNAHDPVASYQELDRYLRQHMTSHHYKTIELPGDSHDYIDFEKLSQLAREF